MGSAVHCTRSLRVQSTECESGGLLPPVHREAGLDPVGWPPSGNFSLASLHCIGREGTRVRVPSRSHLLAGSIGLASSRRSTDPFDARCLEIQDADGKMWMR